MKKWLVLKPMNLTFKSIGKLNNPKGTTIFVAYDNEETAIKESKGGKYQVFELSND